MQGLARDGDLAGRRDLPCEARSETESRWAQTRPGFNKWLTLWLCFLWGLSDSFGIRSGYPILWYPTVALEPQGEREDSS